MARGLAQRVQNPVGRKAGDMEEVLGGEPPGRHLDITKEASSFGGPFIVTKDTFSFELQKKSQLYPLKFCGGLQDS